MTRFTFPLNAVGAPALALPCGRTDAGLPASVQLFGAPGRRRPRPRGGCAVGARPSPYSRAPGGAGRKRSMSDKEPRADHRPGGARGLRSPRVRPLPRGVRGRRDLQALAGEDRDRGRRPPLLPDHDEPPPAAPERRLRVGVAAGAERRRRAAGLLAGARDVGLRRLGEGDRQPRDRGALPPEPGLPRRHALLRVRGARGPAVAVEARPRRRQGPHPRLQADGRPGRRVQARGADPAQEPRRARGDQAERSEQLGDGLERRRSRCPGPRRCRARSRRPRGSLGALANLVAEPIAASASRKSSEIAASAASTSPAAIASSNAARSASKPERSSIER